MRLQTRPPLLTYLLTTVTHSTELFQAGPGPPPSALLCFCFPQCFPDQCHIWTQSCVAIQLVSKGDYMKAAGAKVWKSVG